ncbi:MAG: MFS transporter [bacterium]|nr:MFS transporter [bacterium]
MNPGEIDADQLRGNVRRIQVMNFTWMFLVIMPVIVPYLRDHGLSMEEIYRLQTIFALTIVVLEVPSGYVADLLGRRRCLVAAGVLHGLALTVLAYVDGFWGFAVFELLAAVGVTLYSGTDVALLYDSLEALGDEERTRGLGKRLFWMQTGETVAALVSGALVTVSLYAVAVGNAIVGWLPLVAALGLREVPRERFDRTSHLANFRRIHHELFRTSRLMALIMVNLVAYGLATLLAVWAFQAFWGEMKVPLVAFGFLWAAYNLTVAVVGRAAHRVESRFGTGAVVAAVGVLPIAGYGGMALCAHHAGAGAVWVVFGVLFGFAFQIGRGLTQVVIKDALNVRVPTELRATANSISSMGVRLAFAVLGPLLGWTIDGPGFPAAFGALAAGFGLVFMTLALALVRELRKA